MKTTHLLVKSITEPIFKIEPISESAVCFTILTENELVAITWTKKTEQEKPKQ